MRLKLYLLRNCLRLPLTLFATVVIDSRGSPLPNQKSPKQCASLNRISEICFSGALVATKNMKKAGRWKPRFVESEKAVVAAWELNSGWQMSSHAGETSFLMTTLRQPKKRAVALIETFVPSWLAGWLGWLPAWLAGWASWLGWLAGWA